MNLKSYLLPLILIAALLIYNTIGKDDITINSTPLTLGLSKETFQDLVNNKSYPRVEIRDSEVRQLKSKYVDQVYEIDVFFPKEYKTQTKKYPVVYVLDAEYNFGCVSYIAKRLIKNRDIPEVLLVGIAYNTTEDDYYKKRNRDCTPPSNINGYHTGGVENFIMFLRNELMPFINDNYRTIPEDGTIVGHSISGFFGCYALFKHPELFNRYIIVSTSLWYSDDVIFQYEQEYAINHRDLAAWIYFSTGMDESEQMVSTSIKFISILSGRDYPSIHFKSMLPEDEHHRSLFPSAFTKGMRFVFSQNKVSQ
jgi:predicted alpha/beta superfamily hydrolase